MQIHSPETVSSVSSIFRSEPVLQSMLCFCWTSGVRHCLSARSWKIATWAAFWAAFWAAVWPMRQLWPSRLKFPGRFPVSWNIWMTCSCHVQSSQLHQLFTTLKSSSLWLWAGGKRSWLHVERGIGGATAHGASTPTSRKRTETERWKISDGEKSERWNVLERVGTCWNVLERVGTCWNVDPTWI